MFKCDLSRPAGFFLSLAIAQVEPAEWSEVLATVWIRVRHGGTSSPLTKPTIAPPVFSRGVRPSQSRWGLWNCTWAIGSLFVFQARTGRSCPPTIPTNVAWKGCWVPARRQKIMLFPLVCTKAVPPQCCLFPTVHRVSGQSSSSSGILTSKTTAAQRRRNSDE